MDRIIFGDNQFFGINHRSEDAAIRQAQRFRSYREILAVLEYVKNCGIESFMFTTHSALEPVFSEIRCRPEFKQFRLLPCIPYAYKYANAMTELGLYGAIEKFIPGNVFALAFRGLKSITSANPVPAMRILIDMEMKHLRNNNIEAIFLQSVATDFVLGLGMNFMFAEFYEYIETKYGVRAGFITQNHSKLYRVLYHELNISEPIICSGINKIGFRMNPSQSDVESTIKSARGTTVAMSILASGAIHPREAIEYIRGLPRVDSIVFGASTPNHILETKQLIEQAYADFNE